MATNIPSPSGGSTPSIFTAAQFQELTAMLQSLVATTAASTSQSDPVHPQIGRIEEPHHD